MVYLMMPITWLIENFFPLEKRLSFKGLLGVPKKFLKSFMATPYTADCQGDVLEQRKKYPENSEIPQKITLCESEEHSGVLNSSSLQSPEAVARQERAFTEIPEENSNTQDCYPIQKSKKEHQERKCFTEFYQFQECIESNDLNILLDQEYKEELPLTVPDDFYQRYRYHIYTYENFEGDFLNDVINHHDFSEFHRFQKTNTDMDWLFWRWSHNTEGMRGRSDFMPRQPNFSDDTFSSDRILKMKERIRANFHILYFLSYSIKDIELTRPIELNKPRKCFGNLELKLAKYYWFVQSITGLGSGRTFSIDFKWISKKSLSKKSLAATQRYYKVNPNKSSRGFNNTEMKNILEDEDKTSGNPCIKINDHKEVQDGGLVQLNLEHLGSLERDVSVSTEVTEIQNEILAYKENYGGGYDFYGITTSHQPLQSKKICEIELSDRSIERKYEELRAFMPSEDNIIHLKSLEPGKSFSVSGKTFNTSGEIEVKNSQPPSSNNKDKQSKTLSLNDRGKNNFTNEVLAEAGIHSSSDEHINCTGTSTLLGLLDDVEADGSPSDRTGDPPGQQSIYIPPGDYRKETYRLSTFENFPVASPISRKDLAKNGFYFLGYLDRVKCFSCARSVEKWVITDSPSDRKWHKPTCPFMRGEPTGNTPILNLMGSLAALSGSTSGQEEVIQQRDPNTGQVIRTVRYPADLPERVRRSGGTFQIGPGNTVHVQGGNQQQNFNIGQNQEARTAGLLSTNISTQRAPPQHQPTNRTWTMANVISSDHRRFLTNLFLDRELDRITSFARWPTDRPNVPPAALAKTGFFYLGDMDRTQCFSCGGVLRNWSLQDQAAAQHRIHFTGCRMVTGTETRNIPIPDENETAGQLAVDYPLRFPQNPHMRGQAQREQTFDRRWPAGTIRVTPAQIAEAGFFYLGERDRVKCWYCNGGLQNWELDDIPWDEHSKWFPNCQFLLRTKGQRFVSRYLSPNANLARPIIARQDGSPLNPIGTPQIGSVRGQGQDIPPSVARQRSPTPPPTIIDPQEEMRKRKERVKNILKNSEVVKNVLAMGFAETIVETLLIDRISANKEDNPNDIYGTVSELLDEVMKKEDEIRQEEEETRDQSQSIFSNPSAYSSMSGLSSIGAMAPGSGKYNVSYFDDEDMQDEDMYGSMEGASNRNDTKAKQFLSMETDPKSLQEQLTKLEDEQMCKICFTNKADMVFVPCSHMSCCMECTQAIKHCPVCRTRIERAMKTYSK